MKSYILLKRPLWDRSIRTFLVSNWQWFKSNRRSSQCVIPIRTVKYHLGILCAKGMMPFSFETAYILLTLSGCFLDCFGGFIQCGQAKAFHSAMLTCWQVIGLRLLYFPFLTFSNLQLFQMSVLETGT